MFVCAGTCTICSCSKDVTEENTPGNNTDKDSSSDNNGGDNSSGNNGENLDIHVIVNGDGTTSNGSIFSAIDNQNFYVDYIKYTVTEGHLVVSGYDQKGLKSVAKIISKLTYNGNTYVVLEIAKKAFSGCTALTSITIPNSVTSIGDYAFANCSGLTSVTIGNSVTSIGYEAFRDCTGLTSITIPNSLTSIGSGAFWGCNGLTSVHVTDLAAWCKIDFGNSDSNPLTCAHHLYMNGHEIKDLVIPNSVTSIGRYAFSGCTGLTSVTIPNSVTTIGRSAFNGCSGLTSVTIGNSVTSIGDNAFDFCTGLTDVWCYAEEPPYPMDAFNGSSISTATLHVPAASLEKYRATEPWKYFGQIVAL